MSCVTVIPLPSRFYLCIIFRVISALLSLLSYATVKVVTFPSDSILVCSWDVLAVSSRLFWLIILGLHFHPYLFYNAQNISLSLFVFLACLLDCVCFTALSCMVTFSYASNMFSSLRCRCFCQRLWFVCLCLHGCKSVLLRLIRSIVWFTADGCLPPVECDSWRKLKLRIVDKIEKGGKTRDVITIKPSAQ